MAETATRQARCLCGNLVPSDTAHLAFLRQRGPGHCDDECRVCRYSIEGHAVFNGERPNSVNNGKWPARVAPHDFEPRTEGHEYDSYYCGCRGWD